MKLLLDECTPKRLRYDFSGHAVHTVEEAGLKGLKNGVLLQIASSRFDVLITVDQNIPFQQHLPDLQIAIVILVARSNRYSELRSMILKVQEALADIKPGDVVMVR
jgi:predicted nuclease of predicted toxin-antitoxin system